VASAPKADSQPEASPQVKAVLQTLAGSKLGDIFTLQLDISGPENMQHMPMELSYAADGLEVVSVQLEDLTAQEKTVQISHAANNAQGKLGINLQRLLAKPGKASNFGVQVMFKPKAAGEHAVKLTHFAPMGTQGPLQFEAQLPTTILKVAGP
jgi:hypothetical protein